MMPEQVRKPVSIGVSVVFGGKHFTAVERDNPSRIIALFGEAKGDPSSPQEKESIEDATRFEALWNGSLNRTTEVIIADFLLAEHFVESLLKAEQQRDELLEAIKTASGQMRTCDYTTARETLLTALESGMRRGA